MKLGDLVVGIGANTKKLDEELGKAQRKLKYFGKNTKALGKSLSIGLTAPLAIMGATSVRAFQVQAKAIAQVEAGLKSTGSQAGFTSKQLQAMASDLQSKTLFGDETILKDATAQLLTFTNISGEQFARTQQAALDLGHTFGR
jgi:CRISPR/Cas system type I-B associated protein Csh2 (Cas7 group RAMP superfamily)